MTSYSIEYQIKMLKEEIQDVEGVYLKKQMPSWVKADLNELYTQLEELECDSE